MRGLERVDLELADYVRQAASIFAKAIPGVSLRVTSGYRSPDAQAELRRLWARGDRAGLTSKPASHSRHTEGRAVDLGFAWRGKPVAVMDTPGDYFDALEDLLSPVGVRRIGRNHFEL